MFKQKNNKAVAEKSAPPVAASAGKSVKIQPLHDKVLIKEDKAEERKTEGGIILPDSVGEDKGAKSGKIVAVGEGRYEDGKLIPIKVKIGDDVLFQWGDQVKIDGGEYQIVSESSILAVIK